MTNFFISSKSNFLSL